jgi:hypothetical protein
MGATGAWVFIMQRCQALQNGLHFDVYRPDLMQRFTEHPAGHRQRMLLYWGHGALICPV